MKNEIEHLNNWLDEQAQNASGNWEGYFLGLKDLDQQERFSISTCSTVMQMVDEDYTDPLLEFLANHNKEYKIEGFTGFAVFTKK